MTIPPENKMIREELQGEQDGEEEEGGGLTTDCRWRAEVAAGRHT